MRASTSDRSEKVMKGGCAILLAIKSNKRKRASIRSKLQGCAKGCAMLPFAIKRGASSIKEEGCFKACTTISNKGGSALSFWQ